MLGRAAASRVALAAGRGRGGEGHGAMERAHGGTSGEARRVCGAHSELIGVGKGLGFRGGGLADVGGWVLSSSPDGGGSR